MTPDDRKRLEDIEQRLASLGRKEVLLMSVAATELVDADIPWLIEQLKLAHTCDRCDEPPTTLHLCERCARDDAETIDRLSARLLEMPDENGRTA